MLAGDVHQIAGTHVEILVDEAQLGRLVPSPTNNPCRLERGSQTPTSLPGAVSRRTRAVVGVTLEPVPPIRL